MSHAFQRIRQLTTTTAATVTKLHSAAAVLARLYLGQIFFSAGLTKIRAWDTTLFLFEEEYQVPMLAPEIAAYLATFGELVLPMLLVAGLFSRVSALGLFIVNFVAVISLAEIAPAALNLHLLWGVLLAQLVIYGSGVFTLDALFKRIFARAPRHAQSVLTP